MTHEWQPRKDLVGEHLRGSAGGGNWTCWISQKTGAVLGVCTGGREPEQTMHLELQLGLQHVSLEHRSGVLWFVRFDVMPVWRMEVQGHTEAGGPGRGIANDGVGMPDSSNSEKRGDFRNILLVSRHNFLLGSRPCPCHCCRKMGM